MNIDQKIKKILEILRKRGWTIRVMESCTGGAITNCITNIPGSSDVFKCGWVAYSDEAKIKAGVDEEIIKKWKVYSKEMAEEMAKKATGDLGGGGDGEFEPTWGSVCGGEDKRKSRKYKVKS